MRVIVRRFILAAGAALFFIRAGVPAPAAPADAERVVIGVRVDARPFIWKDAGTGQYLGFLWDICTEAVQRAGYTFSETEVTAETRAAFLNGGTGGYDLLCDPTTMTLERFANFTTGGPSQLEGLRELEFSPIIFIANASYIEDNRGRDLPADLSLPCESPTETAAPESNAASGGSDGGTNNRDSAPPKWLQGLEKKFSFRLRPEKKTETKKYQIWGYIAGSTSAERLERSSQRHKSFTVCLRALSSHQEAAAAFCERDLDRYYGDLDIVREAIADWNRLSGQKCTVPPRTNTVADFYEPYAFVISSGNLPDFPERFTLSLYGMFNDGTVDRLFKGHFADAPRSPYLPTLFRLNSIPAISTEPISLMEGDG